MACEDGLECLAHGVQVLVAECALGVGGRVPSVQQEQVSLSQWQTKGLGQADHHSPAGNRPAVLDETEVPLGGPGQHGELKLADPAPLPPTAQFRSEALLPGGPARHGARRHVLSHTPRSR